MRQPMDLPPFSARFHADVQGCLFLPFPWSGWNPKHCGFIDLVILGEMEIMIEFILNIHRKVRIFNRRKKDEQPTFEINRY